MKRLTTRIVLFSVLFALTTLGTAVAQEAEDAADDPKVDEEFSEEVTVTARKREETLQEVPFSIVAPTEEILRNRGAVNLEDVSANVGGFTVQNLGPGQSQVAMRGVSSGQIVRDQPGRQGAGGCLSRRIGDLAVAVHA